MTQIEGKRVLITGAASGIGKLMAEKLAQRGAELLLWDIDQVALLSLASSLKNRGYLSNAAVCDLSKREQIQTQAALTLKQFNSVDILINNAGIVSGKYLTDHSDAEIEAMFQVNVLSVIHLIRAFLPFMIRQGHGHIVFVSSASALCATSKLSIYSATKYAMTGLEEALRFELQQLAAPVKTTVVFPYFIDTGLFAGAKTRFPLLLPILKAENVADKIVNAIAQDKHRLFIPRFVYTALLSKALPLRAFDFLVNFFGITRSMDEFRGRKKED